jgi:hypothetical protein
MRKAQVVPAVVVQRQKRGTQMAYSHALSLFPFSLLFHLSDTNVKSTCNAYDCVMLGRFRSVD